LEFHYADLRALGIDPSSNEETVPCPRPLPGGPRHGLWLDQFATGRGYLPITSANLGSVQNFRTRTDYSMGGTRKRHGSILNITAAEQARWGASTPVNRIQSFNLQDRYVRHVNFDVRIDPNASPAQGAQFRYIRHYNYLLRLDQITTTARSDATFRVMARWLVVPHYSRRRCGSSGGSGCGLSSNASGGSPAAATKASDRIFAGSCPQPLSAEMVTGRT
jgi:hypothetical protein